MKIEYQTNIFGNTTVFYFDYEGNLQTIEVGNNKNIENFEFNLKMKEAKKTILRLLKTRQAEQKHLLRYSFNDSSRAANEEAIKKISNYIREINGYRPDEQNEFVFFDHHARFFYIPFLRTIAPKWSKAKASYILKIEALEKDFSPG